jgi:hypothetical protein
MGETRFAGSILRDNLDADQSNALFFPLVGVRQDLLIISSNAFFPA